MAKYSSTKILIICLFFTLCACEKDSEISAGSRNQWIYNQMMVNYLWNDQIPASLNFNNPDSKKFFESLLYSQDRWSYITDDYQGFLANLQGKTVNLPYQYKAYLMRNNQVYLLINYVYPESDAAKKGLKRGDIIVSINGNTMDANNYYDIAHGSYNFSVKLGEIQNNDVVPTEKSISFSTEVTNTSPIIYYNIIQTSSCKVGYIVYVSFADGNNNAFLKELDNIFSIFKANGVSQLIVDLRYNPGGLIDPAIHMASEIAPADVVNSRKVLINLIYNKDIQGYINPVNARHLFDKSGVTTNLDLSEVYFLTTKGSASASELVIAGLKPYMNVIQIGTATYGKYMGAAVIPDNNKQWAISPIILKYANIDGLTEFVDGLTPDYYLEEKLTTKLHPFGSDSDPFLAKALSLIDGTKAVDAPIMQQTEDFPKALELPDDVKRNLFVNPF